MTDEQRLLFHLIERANVPGDDALLISPDQAREWPTETLAALAETGLLRRAAPAASITCPACEDDHVTEVLLPDGDSARPYIYCRQEGHVLLSDNDLACWSIDLRAFATGVQQVLHLEGLVRERRGGRLWSLGRGALKGYVDIWLLRGPDWPDANDILGEVSIPANAWIFTTSQTLADYGGRPMLPLEEFVRYVDGRIDLDLAQLAVQQAAMQPSRAGGTPRNVFKKDGDGWSLRFNGGELFHLRHREGLADIHTLLLRPGEDVSALELAEGEAVDGLENAVRFQAGLELADEDAIRDIEERLRRPDVPEEERAALLDHLGAVKGVRGIRSSPDAMELARTRVTKRIKTALTTIDGTDRDMADFLRTHIRTGTYLSYRSPSPPIEWQLR